MIYSRFNAARADYDVFEDGERHPLNGDFPVPRLDRDVGGIGVPASEAGRALPTGARRVGSSWHARGLLVRPERSSLGAMTKDDWGKVVVPAALIGATAFALFWAAPRLFPSWGRW